MGLAQRPRCCPARPAVPSSGCEVAWNGQPSVPAAVPNPPAPVGTLGPSSPAWAAPAPASLPPRTPRARARPRPRPARGERDAGPAGLWHQHGDPPVPRPRSGSPAQPLPHLQGVVEEFAHAAEAAALPLVPPQPLQRVRDVPLLDGHVGAGLPEGLEDKRGQPGARDTSQGRGSARGCPGWQEEPWVQLQSPHQVLPSRSLFPKAL